MAIIKPALLSCLCLGAAGAWAQAPFQETPASDSTQILSEVVVTVPYSKQKKESYTGSAHALETKALAALPVAGIDRGLQGLAPGVAVNASSGQPGSTPEIAVRGQGSLSASSQPLFVLDGMPLMSGKIGSLYGSSSLLSLVAAEDLESVSVLKDAASSSLYGTRGSNGVIMMKLKQAKKDRTSVSLTAQHGYAYPLQGNLSLLTADEYRSLLAEGMRNAGKSQGEIDEYLKQRGKASTNWQDEVLAPAPNTSAHLSFSRGGKIGSLYASGSYRNQEGIVLETGNRQLGGLLSGELPLAKKLSLSLTNSFAQSSQRTGKGLGSMSDPVIGSYLLAPSLPVKNSDGSFAESKGDYNVVAVAHTDEDGNTLMHNLSMGTLSYKHSSRLKFSSSISYDYASLEENSLISPQSVDGKESGGRRLDYQTRQAQYQWSNVAQYQGDIAKGHQLSAQAAAEYARWESRFTRLIETGFAEGFEQETELSDQSRQMWVMASAAFAAQYGLLSKYFASASFRADGSSRFDQSRRWAPFWSAGLAWASEREPWMKPILQSAKLKLRASAGTSGNAEVGNYAYLPLISPGADYNSQAGTAVTQLYNPDLSWEKSLMLNLGADYSWKQLSIALDVYRRSTSDLLSDVPISAANGLPSLLQNVGAMSVQGAELSISLKSKPEARLSWQASASCSRSSSIVEELYGGADIIDGLKIRREGQPFYTFHLAEWAGVNPADGSALWVGENGQPTTDFSKARMIVTGNAEPDFIASLSGRIGWRGISLSLQLYASVGGDVYNNSNEALVADGRYPRYNQSAQIKERWQQVGDKTSVPRLVFGNTSSSNETSTRYLEDGSYLRLKQAMISWQLPQPWRMHLTQAELFASCSNLLTLTGYSGADPEQTARGTTFFAYPQARMAMIGARLGM